LSLIPVEKSELVLGQPLAWALYDSNHRLLKAEGEAIVNAEELRTLLATPPLREFSWTGTSVTPNGNADAPPEIDLSDTQQERFSFYDMNLKPGDRIQLQPPAQLGTERHIVRLVGYLDSVSLLVTSPMVNGVRLALLEEEAVVARIFSGQNAYGFTTTVRRICKLPFDYLHLAFPMEIQGAVIRKSPRIKINIIASVTDPGNESAEALPGMIVNISSSGARIAARMQLGTIGQVLRLSFRVNLRYLDVYLTASALIRSVFTDETADKPGQPVMVQHGVEFQDLKPNDSMILQSLIYQQMIEQPQTVV